MNAADHVLHVVVYWSLHVLSPQHPHAVRASSLFPQRRSVDAAGRQRRGMCLSRALTVTAGAWRSEIGVARPSVLNAQLSELDGNPLRPMDVRRAEIARLQQT